MVYCVWALLMGPLVYLSAQVLIHLPPQGYVLLALEDPWREEGPDRSSPQNS